MTRQREVTNRGGTDDENYVLYLEGKLDKLVGEVRKLKSEAKRAGGRKGNLREMRITYKWTEADIDCSETVMQFCSEYLFPRFKFLKKGDVVDNDERRGFAAFVKRHLTLPDDMVFDEKWEGLIAPTIVKKYTDMRCNVNARVTSVFLGKY